jgi:hypothetical protein
MSATHTESLPPTSDLVEGVLFYPIALVISATIFPGFTLAIPGLLFVTALVLIPLVAVAIVALLAAAVLASPFLLVRGVRGLRVRWAESRRKPGFANAKTRPSATRSSAVVEQLQGRLHAAGEELVG